jgi:hypothetical protein
MKKGALLFISALVSVLTLAGSNEEAQRLDSGVTVVKKEGASYHLIYTSVEASDVTVTILNKDNGIIFKETIKKSEGFIRPYNFKNLPEGKYTFKIESGARLQVETIDLLTQVTASNVIKLASVDKVK